jgi:hypothetical protein
MRFAAETSPLTAGVFKYGAAAAPPILCTIPQRTGFCLYHTLARTIREAVAGSVVIAALVGEYRSGFGSAFDLSFTKTTARPTT